jgi:hypothetical protein
LSIVYRERERHYSQVMASILTTEQQRTAGAAARKAGGYAEVIRLERERRAAKGQGSIQRDSRSGRLTFTNSTNGSASTK